MITETITLKFDNEAQQKRFHARLNGETTMALEGVYTPSELRRMDAADEARLQAITDVYQMVLAAAGDAMKRHGNDPLATTVLAAGFTMAIRAIGEDIDPKVPE